MGQLPLPELVLGRIRRRIHAKRSGPVWQWLHLIETMERSPDILVAENVEGLVSASNGENYLALHKELARMGYRAGAVHLNACKWVPQSRPRIFVIAVKGYYDPKYPEKQKSQLAAYGIYYKRHAKSQKLGMVEYAKT